MPKRASRSSKSSPSRGSRRLRTFRVSHSITDFYFRDLRALTPENALRNAQRHWDARHEAAFQFDISRGGGNGDWEVEEATP